ncbi:uncharacterized protein PGTG_22397 [Puccinia graminis f. sp. tritici CRL 75-36-700-3]|uniref:Tyr recombinase domain-containing protein n=1 Tax=Puccinia graminis f. sp. tritici (strain CRL 75-36-700-3 / race SCCL) TaxID=418459 RepID=H6QUE6_PUCGT|nr:uncharacterized protein PGTG_22397 [Puccinia graminis f. sp. tritici CRL 75-36-700-3]EHS64609.1 hypothetical protein PGTG_22397 [Puccinia graminis f. sp. tritici CRL 75-36-700-3]
MLDLKRLSAITSNGSEPREPTAQERHYLLGYRWNTLLSYNAAIKKYQNFARDTGKPSFRLPLTAQDIYDFCCWAGRTAESSTTHEISANTLSKYLAGLQMWHVYHNAVYPSDSKTKVATFLKSSAYVDAETEKKPKKKPVTIENLVKLTELLIDGDPFQKALLDLSVVAFWGMARLAELTYNEGSGPLRRTASLLTTDVELVYKERENLAKLTIRGAKTADPGQSQIIYLKELPHMLCPVLAVKRRLAEAGGAKTSLFGYTDHQGERVHLTKPQTTRALSKIWGACGFEGVSGHSFRVGGASIQVALGVPISEIRIRGRWVSDAYKLYLRDFTEEEMRRTNDLLARLEECWMHYLATQAQLPPGNLRSGSSVCLTPFFGGVFLLRGVPRLVPGLSRVTLLSTRLHSGNSSRVSLESRQTSPGSGSQPLRPSPPRPTHGKLGRPLPGLRVSLGVSPKKRRTCEHLREASLCIDGRAASPGHPCAAAVRSSPFGMNRTWFFPVSPQVPNGWSISGSATGTEACPWRTPSRSPDLTHCPALVAAHSASQPRSRTENSRRSVRRGEEPQPNTVSLPTPRQFLLLPHPGTDYLTLSPAPTPNLGSPHPCFFFDTSHPPYDTQPQLDPR